MTYSIDFKPAIKLLIATLLISSFIYTTTQVKSHSIVVNQYITNQDTIVLPEAVLTPVH
jgi:hypothetical protein